MFGGKGAEEKNEVCNCMRVSGRSFLILSHLCPHGYQRWSTVPAAAHGGGLVVSVDAFEIVRLKISIIRLRKTFYKCNFMRWSTAAVVICTSGHRGGIQYDATRVVGRPIDRSVRIWIE